MPGALAPVTRLGEAFRGVVDGHTIVDYMRQLLIALAWVALAIALAARAYRFNMSTGHYPGDFAGGICAG